MRGSIRQRANGHWQLRVYVGKDLLTGEKRWKSATCKGGKREAERMLAKMVADVGESATAGADASLRALCDKFLDYGSVRRWSPTTLAGYRCKLGHVCDVLGHIPLNKLTPEHVDAYLRRRLEEDGANPVSVRHEYVVLGTALRQAVKWGWVEKAVTDRVALPEARPRDVGAPTVETVKALIDLARSSRNNRSPLISFLALTGMRRGEACGLRWADIDFERGTITIRRTLLQTGGRTLERHPKSERGRRTFALDDLCLSILTSRWADMQSEAEVAGAALGADGYVWSDDADGKTPLKPDIVSQYVRRLGKRLGVTLGPHQLRHFATTYLISEGYDVRTVAGRHGHDPVVAMGRYAHLVEERDRAAAATLGRALAPASSRSAPTASSVPVG